LGFLADFPRFPDDWTSPQAQIARDYLLDVIGSATEEISPGTCQGG
jgi:hypothetical protein